MPHSGSSAVSISVIRLLVLESGCFADQAASAVAPDEIIRPQRRAVVQLHVDDGVVLREARHLTSAIDRHRQLADPTGQYALDAVLPQPEPVVVQRGKVADVQGDPGEPRDLRHLPPREEPIVERRASISPIGPPPATTTACPVIAAPRPASRRPPPARRAPATAPRPPPSVRRSRATRMSTTTHAFRPSHLRGFRLRPALCGTTGGLKQAPGALYIGSGRRGPANRTGHGSFGPGWGVLGYSSSSDVARRRLRIRHEALEDGIGDAPLEAPQSLLAGFALRDLLAVVGSASGVRPGLASGDHVQGVIELAVASQREPVAHHLPAGSLHRRCTGVGGEVRLGRKSHHVADRPDDLRCQYGSYAEDLGEGGAGSFYLGFDALV